MRTETIRLYEDNPFITLTTYVLEDSPEMLKGKDRPAILICPGGGYFSCSDREGEPIALKFASMGYHAFVLRYSTYMEGGMAFPDLSKPLPVKESCQFPKPMQEIGKAMLIIQEHAKEWHVDGTRIAVCGFSAGAHNAAMYATNWHTDLILGHFGEPEEKLRPAAAILGYMLSDYVFMRDNLKNQAPMDQAFFQASNTAYMGEADPDEERLVQISPARNVSEHTPPMYLWATSEDSLVPVQHTIRMANALAEHKIPFEVHIFEKGPHGLGLATQATAESKSQIFPDAAKWTDLAGAWLEKRFALELPEKSGFEEMLEKGMMG